MATNEASMSPRAASTRSNPLGGARESGRVAHPSNEGAVYGLGMIGALVYFLGTAGTGGERLQALGKAVIWPAILVYRAFRVLPG